MSASDRSPWPSTERRRGDRRATDRRSRGDRRDEAAWQSVSLDDDAQVREAALIAAARAARRNAQAAYSGFKVGAALESSDRGMSTGCNVENASYGLTVCAERVALLKALSEGITTFERIVVVADTATPTPPCGPCRQLLWEYCGDIEVIIANLEATLGRYQLAELLPRPFDNRLLR